ncbi:DGQHR domain-containing protein [Lysinibacillus fusiformis]|uniref:DGQHR domain-containing protein n=1 Tax=Lysinibacillus fusiformis TaxID=28031 RepID=UPI0021C1C5D9|nr:DGQHR domain-containing protein [Lysinibacillus fusiformis]UXJ68183.1 DGQHR domain-containing protein [Lysinibacillus fusiformis]
MINMPYLKLNQPIGELYIGTLSVEQITSFSKVYRRQDDKENGIQRNLDKKRVKSIKEFSETSDAVFPTPIILSGKDKYVAIDDKTIHIDVEHIIFNNDYFSIVDGQHRIAGISESAMSKEFILPVILIFNTILPEDAQLFSVINGNQKPVSKSLIYELFSYSNNRSLERTGHIIAKELDSNPKSPFYKKLKMLGVVEKTSKEALLNRNLINEDPDETPLPSLSQGLFIDILIEYISKDRKEDNNRLLPKNNSLFSKIEPLEMYNNPKYIFREYFISENDDIIYLVIRNFFNAVKDLFPEQWNNKNSIISKSTGYTALMMLLAHRIYPKAKELDNYSRSIFRKLLNETLDPDIDRTAITSVNFGSSKAGSKKLYEYLIGERVL